MNKQNLVGFKNEIQKEAKFLPLTRGKGVIKRFFAKRKGAKDIYKQTSNEAAAMLKKDPKFNVGGYMKERGAQLTRLGKEQASTLESATIKGGKGVKGKSFTSRHKKGLIVGGAAAAGGLYLANSANAERDFPLFHAWGTLGWIVAGVLISYLEVVEL